MFGDIGWAELLVIGIVALIVIGPEDLPDMFRQLGRFTAKLRQMSREFSRAMEQAAKESGVKDVTDDLKAVTSPKSLGLTKVKEAADRFEKWDPIKNAAKPTGPARPLTPPPMPETPKPAAALAGGMAAAEAVPEAAAVVRGPETQALYDRKAARAAIMAETAEKLKAVGTAKPAEPDADAGAESAAARPAPKPRARKAAGEAVAAQTLDPVLDGSAAKPRARKKKADEA